MKKSNKVLRYLTKIEKEDVEEVNHLKTRTSIDINVAHERLAHMCVEQMKNTAKEMKWNLTGELLPFHGCMVSKPKQKNVNKMTLCKDEK